MKWMLGLLFASMLGMAAVSAESLPDFEEFVEEFREKRADIMTLQARFRQHNFTTADRFTNEGELLYIRPRRLLFRYSDPPVTYAVDDLMVYEHDADLAQVQQMRLEDHPETEALFLGFESDLTRLREAYAVSLFTPDEDECGSVGLRLEPEVDAEEARGFFEEAWLYLRDEDYIPCRIHLINPDGSQVLIEIPDPEVNVKLTPRETSVWVPRGTRIVPEQGPVETAGAEGRWLLPAQIPPSMERVEDEDGAEGENG